MKAFSLFLTILVLFLSACHHTPERAQVAVYGEPGPDKITISIGGSVEMPGRYYVSDGATLASISELFGRFRTCETCGLEPSRVVVLSEGPPQEKRRYSLFLTNELTGVRLHDGDRVLYQIVHF